MGKASNLRRDIANAKPCRLCGQTVMIVKVDYRVVPSHIPLAHRPDDDLDMLSMPTLSVMVLDAKPDEDGFFVVNVDPNAIAAEGFVAYDPEMSLDAPEWGYTRYRGHNCPKGHDKTERAHANRTFIDGRIVRADRADREAVGRSA